MKKIDISLLTSKDSPLPWLSAQESSALQDYCTKLVSALSREHVKSVILFGSKARGDAHPHSDLDLLAILEPGDEDQRRAELRVDSDIVMDHGVPLNVLAMSAQKAAADQQMGEPLMQNIVRDGIVLWGEEFQVSPMDQRRFMREYMQSARDRLKVSKAAIDVGGYRDSVSRSYYACLDAADAALIAVGIMPQSHEGTRKLFSPHLIKTQRLAETYKDIFEQTQKARASADYDRGAHVTQSSAEHAYQRSGDFVNTIEHLLHSLLPDWDKP